MRLNLHGNKQSKNTQLDFCSKKFLGFWKRSNRSEQRTEECTERDGPAVDRLLEGVHAGLQVVAEGSEALAEQGDRLIHLHPL